MSSWPWPVRRKSSWTRGLHSRRQRHAAEGDCLATPQGHHLGRACCLLQFLEHCPRGFLDEVAEPCPADRRQVDIPWFGWVKLLQRAEHNHHAGKRGEHGQLGREASFRPFMR